MGELGCGLVGRITPRADSDGCAEMPATDPPMYALHAEICGMQLLAAGDVCGNGRSVKCVGETMHRVGSCESAMRDEDPCVNRHSMVYMRCTTVRSTVKYSMKERPYSYVFVFCRAQAPRACPCPRQSRWCVSQYSTREAPCCCSRRAAGPWTNNTTTLDHLVTELTCTGHVS